jgi:hypothetical protein
MGRIKAKGVTEVMGTRQLCRQVSWEKMSESMEGAARLRPEFVAFSKWPKIDAANKAVTTTESSKIPKRHELSGQAFAGQPRRRSLTWVVAFSICVVVVSVR